MPNTPKLPNEEDSYDDIPVNEGDLNGPLNELRETGAGSTEPASPTGESAPNKDPEAPLKQDGGLDEKPFASDDISGVQSATDEEINTRSKVSDVSDLNEDFSRHDRARINDEKNLRKRRFLLEQKLHAVDLSARAKFSNRYSPLTDELFHFIADHLGITKGAAIEAAALMFYRNCFSNERRMLNDLGLMLDSFSLQTQELNMEASAIENLALMAIESEMSPADPEDFPELNRNNNEPGALEAGE